MMATDVHAITLSLPETQALATRAARGAGHHWGVAEECGLAATWLAQRGLDWAGIVLDCLTDPGSTELALAEKAWTGPDPLCPLLTGVALADFAALPEGPADGLTIGPVAHPLMILTFVSRAAATLGCTFDVLCDNRRVASCSGTFATRIDTELGGPVTLVLRPRPADIPPHPPSRDAPLTPAQKARLDALAALTFVPTSAQSEAGAGSERSDND